MEPLVDDHFLFPFNDLTNIQLDHLLRDCNEHAFHDRSFENYLNNAINDDFTSNNFSCSYYNESDFNEIVKDENVHLSIFHLNIRSLPKNHLQLIAYLGNIKQNFDIILLSEIGHSNMDHLRCIFTGYDLEYVASPSKCGGVGIFYKSVFNKHFIKKQVISKNLNCSCSQCQIEDIWVGLSNGNQLFCVSACYRHPKGNIKHFLDSLEQTLSSSFFPYMCIIGGDFNVDVLKIESRSMCKDYANLMLCNSFIPTITLPTRITHYSATLIDNIFVRLPNNLLDNTMFSGNLFTDLSDHLPSFCVIEGSCNRPNSRPFMRFYDQKNFNNFLQSIESYDFSSVYKINVDTS